MPKKGRRTIRITNRGFQIETLPSANGAPWFVPGF